MYNMVQVNSEVATDGQYSEHGAERIKNYVKPKWWLSEQRLYV